MCVSRKCLLSVLKRFGNFSCFYTLSLFKSVWKQEKRPNQSADATDVLVLLFQDQAQLADLSLAFCSTCFSKVIMHMIGTQVIQEDSQTFVTG